MSEQHRNKLAVDNWLCSGGAEVVLDVLRRYGWKIEVLAQDDWELVDDVVVTGNRKQNTMEIYGVKSPWQQAFFAALIDGHYNPVQDASNNRWYSVLRESDKFYETDLLLCYNFIDQIRVSSEVTVAIMSKATRKSEK